MALTLGFVTSARSDFGLLLPVIRAAMGEPAFAVRVYATGMHFSSRHGQTLDEVLASGLESCLTRVPVDVETDCAVGMANAIGCGVTAFAQVFAAAAPDLLVVLGDRFDMVPAVLAALPFNLPVVHLCGGELSEGVIDDAIRHAVTKLSHLHFPALLAYGERLIRMGEEPWRVTVTGQPGLDVLTDFPFAARDAVLARWGLSGDRPVTVFTFHPETLSVEGTRQAIAAVLAAAAAVDTQILMTYPNADTSGEVIIGEIERFAAQRADCRVVPHLGRDNYLNLLHQADAMVGNSSSGIIEAASFALPVVDIGGRQQGRLAAANVIRVPVDRDAIAAAWRQALTPRFRAGLAGLVNLYGDGHAVERIVSRLKAVELGPRLLIKRFHDGPYPPGI